VAGPRARNLRWYKSTASGTDNCVEVAFDGQRCVFMRSSHSPDGPILEFATSEWIAFVRGVIAGEFDRPPVT
jgi:hypothetical protein